jgi:hypothetical protein
MGHDNPTWGAPRITSELRLLGYRIAESTVSKYLPQRRKPPSQLGHRSSPAPKRRRRPTRAGDRSDGVFGTHTYGEAFRLAAVKNLGIEEVLSARHSPWQNPWSA